MVWPTLGSRTAKEQEKEPTPQACRTPTQRMPAKTPFAGDKIDAPAACAVPFRPYCGVLQREREMLASTCLYSLYA